MTMFVSNHTPHPSFVSPSDQQWIKDEKLMEPYWPHHGTSGAVLVTSRLYHNFIKEERRSGSTIKPFDYAQSWELLLGLLGDDWKAGDRERNIAQSEVAAAKGLLRAADGNALAILLISLLIKGLSLGEFDIVSTYKVFKEQRKILPERLSKPRLEPERSLDALWEMAFMPLTKNARLLIGVLSWLSSGESLVITNKRNNCLT